MSIETKIVFCSNCSFETSDGYNGKVYYYSFQNKEKIFADRTNGWCSKCNDLKVIILGLVAVDIQDEVYALNNELTKMNKRVFLFGKPKSVIQRTNIINDTLEEKRKLLQIIRNQNTKSFCTECGSLDVIPIKLEADKVVYLNGQQVEHPNCGGLLHVKNSGIRFRFKTQEIIVEPAF